MPIASYDLELNQQLLMVRPIGAWSEEFACRFITAVNHYLHDPDRRFAGLVDLRQWELGTPQAMAVINKSVLHASTLGYCLELHFGEPKMVHLQITKHMVTPKNVNLLQTNNLEEIEKVCEEYGYCFDRQVLESFLAKGIT